MATTNISITACDNELHLIATNGAGSSEICHISSGFGNPVNYSVIPQSILPPGQYTLIMVGINWGGPQAFTVTLTIDGVETPFTAPPSSQVGANWTVATPMTV